MIDKATEMAKERTDWALERTRLAKERTFASVVRTALSFIGFGIIIAKLLPNLQPHWVAQTLGILLIVGGGIITFAGFRSTHDVITKLQKEGAKEPRWLVVTTTLLLLVATILALLIVGVGLIDGT